MMHTWDGCIHKEEDSTEKKQTREEVEDLMKRWREKVDLIRKRKGRWVDDHINDAHHFFKKNYRMDKLH